MRRAADDADPEGVSHVELQNLRRLRVSSDIRRDRRRVNCGKEEESQSVTRVCLAYVLRAGVFRRQGGGEAAVAPAVHLLRPGVICRRVVDK